MFYEYASQETKAHWEELVCKFIDDVITPTIAAMDLSPQLISSLAVLQGEHYQTWPQISYDILFGDKERVTGYLIWLAVCYSSFIPSTLVYFKEQLQPAVWQMARPKNSVL